MIVPTLARLIVREHLYNPIYGTVLTLGRQTIAMTYEQVLELLQQEGYVVPDHILSETQVTQDQKTRYGKDTTFISDNVFFGLLGIKDLLAMDVSSYEDADILHNLNEPIPETLYGQFDFIIDGGTFDHCFDVRTAFENVVRMLKPNGRIFHWNAASNFTGAAYLSFGPDIFYDYYILNQFADCKVYVAEVDRLSQSELWNLYEFEGGGQYSHFRSARIQMVIVLAEKSSSSTWDRMPVQAQYRDESLWNSYRTGLRLIQKSNRKPWGVEKGLALPNTGIRFQMRRGFNTLKNLLIQMRGIIPDKWKRKIPLKLKIKVNAVLQNQEIRGYRYVGRI